MRRPRPKKSPVPYVAGGILLVIAILVGVIVMQRGREQETLEEALEQIQQNMAEVMRQVAADPEFMPEDQAGLMASQARLLREKADQAGGRAAKILRAIGGLFDDEAAALRVYEQAFERLEAAGFVVASNLDSRPKIAAHRKRVDDFRRANDALSAFFDRMEETFLGHLAAQGVAEKDRGEIRRGFLTGLTGQRRLLGKIRAADEELCDLLDEILRLLEAELGKWQALGDMVQFESDAAVETYNELVGEIQKVAMQQSAAQQQLAGQYLQGVR